MYHYDIHDPCRYQSNNNRLEYYEVWDETPEPDELVSTTYYYYTGKGNVVRGRVAWPGAGLAMIYVGVTRPGADLAMMFNVAPRSC